MTQIRADFMASQDGTAATLARIARANHCSVRKVMKAIWPGEKW